MDRRARPSSLGDEKIWHEAGEIVGEGIGIGRLLLVDDLCTGAAHFTSLRLYRQAVLPPGQAPASAADSLFDFESDTCVATKAFSDPMILQPHHAHRDLVLVGGGHAHVEVLRQYAMNRAADTQITLIGRDALTPYSGMLPGLIAGHYTHDEVHIDLRPLARAAGARFYRSAAVDLDLQGKRVICADRPPVDFDCLSLDVGSFPGWQGIPGAPEHTLPIKPADRFIAGWNVIERSLGVRDKALRIVVVGGGAGGTEICLALQHRVSARFGRDAARFAIVTNSAELLPAHSPGVRRRLTRVVAARGIELHCNRTVVGVDPGIIRCDPDDEIAFDAAIWATGAASLPWLAKTGLATDVAGFVKVNSCLQSISHPFVFAAGDIAAVADHCLAKSGVFAVREGLPLARNLRRACRGDALETYRPQRHHLALISTGHKYVIASRGSWSAEGTLLWRLKDRIDRRWMSKYRDRAAMGAVHRPNNGAMSREMRCGGCGAKVGSEILKRVLERLRPATHPDVVIGIERPDDAAVLTVPGNQLLVQSVDYFRAFIDDPYLFGRIAANHCLGDLYAMGATPQTALAIVTLPHGSEAQIESDLIQLLSGATAALDEADSVLVGGHTGEGAELAFGLTVNGIAAPERLWRKSGMRDGDHLILTKPLGTGTLFAADMRGLARGPWIDAALTTMLTSNRAAAGALRRHGATACTDVTGFGLVGHLLEMLRASGTDAGLSLTAIPGLSGALELLAQGIASTLAPQNLAQSTAVDLDGVAVTDPRVQLLYDPQTSGGLLASVPADAADACLAELRSSGVSEAACIGTVLRRAGDVPRISARP